VHAGHRNQWEKNHDRRERGAQEWNGQFTQSALDCRESILACVAVQDNVFENHDCVVDDQTDRGGETAERHEVKTLSRQLQNDKSDQESDRNDQPCYERGSPISEEKHENDGRKYDSDENRVANTRDRAPNNERLIVKRFEVNSFGQ